MEVPLRLKATMGPFSPTPTFYFYLLKEGIRIVRVAVVVTAET